MNADDRHPDTLPGLSHAMSVRLDFQPERLRAGPTPSGLRFGFVGVTGGAVWGRDLNGTVVPGSGGDWPLIEPDGTFLFDARYMIELVDGTLVYVQNRGMAHAAPDVAARLERGEAVSLSENYFRTTPTFTVAHGPHDWLMRRVFVGYGDKRADHSLFHFYAVL